MQYNQGFPFSFTYIQKALRAGLMIRELEEIHWVGNSYSKLNRRGFLSYGFPSNPWSLNQPLGVFGYSSHPLNFSH
jgi:hypothetical protein